jgi:hypothetical protein
MNKYQTLANLCYKLETAFNEYNWGQSVDNPYISISDNGKYVEVVWDQWGELSKEERNDMVVEAYYQAFGTKQGLKLNSACGLMKDKNGNTF